MSGIKTSFTTLFLDVGGVILTNGWDHHMREHAAELFHLNYKEMSDRHALTFDTYEIGKITLDEYLDRVVFYETRSFTKEAFKEFMFQQSQPYQDMLQLMRQMKTRYSLKIIVVSNEGRELMEHRVQRFNLKDFVDTFICSGFVHLRKPDEEIYRIAIDVAQVNPKEVIYIDDRLMLAEIGQKIGFQAIRHQSFEQTQLLLNKLLSSSSTKD